MCSQYTVSCLQALYNNEQPQKQAPKNPVRRNEGGKVLYPSATTEAVKPDSCQEMVVYQKDEHLDKGGGDTINQIPGPTNTQEKVDVKPHLSQELKPSMPEGGSPGCGSPDEKLAGHSHAGRKRFEAEAVPGRPRGVIVHWKKRDSSCD